MTEETMLINVMDSRVQRREDRREFFRAFGTAAKYGGAVIAASTASLAQAQAAPTDADVLNFALNLEYLEAQFYSFAAFGSGLPSDMLDGTGSRGEATGGRRVNFTDPIVSQYAREIAFDEAAHVRFLRGALGTARVAQPTIDIGIAPNGSFSSAARASGLIGDGASFDAYANDENFLLAAFIFEDVGVTAFKGAAPLLTNKTFLEASAGILAVEAYHAAIIRTTLFRKGIQTPALIDATEMISNARDTLDGTRPPADRDQGIRPNPANTSNIAPLDANGLAFSRTAQEVLNIVYLNRLAVDRGGFFPAGVNGNIKVSAAN